MRTLRKARKEAHILRKGLLKPRVSWREVLAGRYKEKRADGYRQLVFYHLEHLLIVYNKSEFERKRFRCLAAHYHASQEYLKIIHHGTILGIDG